MVGKDKQRARFVRFVIEKEHTLFTVTWLLGVVSVLIHCARDRLQKIVILQVGHRPCEGLHKAFFSR
jgi:hypothetical protein